MTLGYLFQGIFMAKLDMAFRADRIDATAFLAPGVVILGNVTIAKFSSVWYNSVIRGDTECISIGSCTNIQDGCVLHADLGIPCRLGNRVTLGHGAIVHGAEIDDDVMIGMRAVVMNSARIGSGCIIGVGAVVTESTEIPPNSVVLGIPGRVVRATTDKDRERIAHAAEHYVEAAKAYLNNSGRV